MKGVAKVFPGDRRALGGVDLAIGDREFFAVLGASGSGKSTLLRILAGLEAPTSGTLTIGGRDARGLPARGRDAAIVFQNQALYPHLSVRDNLAASAWAAGVGRDEIDRRVGVAAEMLGLGPHLDARPNRISGGQAQRVALGRAFVRRPSLLLLDEPFSNLDPPLKAALMDDLAALHKRIGGTTVLVTHDPNEAAALADRIAFLDCGIVAQVGPPRALFDRPETAGVARFFGDPPRTVLEVRVEVEEGGARLLAGGDRALVAVGSADRGWWRGLAGRSVLVALGPDEVEVGPSGPGAPGPTGTVDRIVERERERLAGVRIGGAEVWCRIRPGCGLGERELVRVAIDLDRAGFFEPESGRRLPDGG